MPRIIDLEQLVMSLHECIEDDSGPRRASFSIDILSDIISADAIQDALGFKPSFARNRGETAVLTNPKSLRYTRTKVLIDLTRSDSRPIDDQLSECISEARTIIDKLHAVKDHCEIYLSVSILDKSWDTNICLTPDTLRELTEIGIGIDFLVTTNELKD